MKRFHPDLSTIYIHASQPIECILVCFQPTFYYAFIIYLVKLIISSLAVEFSC